VTNATEPDPIPSPSAATRSSRAGPGRMGVVYEAAIRPLARHRPEDDPPRPPARSAVRGALLLRGRIAARLSHPVDRGGARSLARPESGTLYIALEHLLGRTLAEIAEAGPLDAREVCVLGGAIARASTTPTPRGSFTAT